MSGKGGGGGFDRKRGKMEESKRKKWENDEYR
jgi:hypothetical protein